MTGRFVLSPLAQTDLDLIWNYTEARWGTKQAELYTRQIVQNIEVASATPTSGRACCGVRSGYFKVRSGSHFVFYRLTDGGIDVVRILHQRMDAERHVP